MYKITKELVVCFAISIGLFASPLFAQQRVIQCGDYLMLVNSKDIPTTTSAVTIEPNPYYAAFRPSALVSVLNSNYRSGERVFLPYLGWKLLEGTSYEKDFGFFDKVFGMSSSISITYSHSYPESGFIAQSTPSDTAIQVLAYQGGLMDKLPSEKTLNKFGPVVVASPISNDLEEIASQYEHIILSPESQFSLGDLIRNQEFNYSYNSYPGDKKFSSFKPIIDAKITVEHISIVRDSTTGIQAYLIRLKQSDEMLDFADNAYKPSTSYIKLLLPASFDRDPMAELFFSLFVPKKPLSALSSSVTLVSEDMAEQFRGWNVAPIQPGENLVYWLQKAPFNIQNLMVHPGVSQYVGQFRNARGYIEFTLPSAGYNQPTPLNVLNRGRLENQVWSNIQTTLQEIVAQD